MPRLGVEPALSKAEAAMTCTANIQSVIESTRKALQQTADRMEVWLDTTHVWVDGRPSCKLTEKWIGPYKVLSVKPNAVELHLPRTLHIHPVLSLG
ncbi:hypothetical protein PISMIDRAFT_114846 [Pisolithus microcarpus 441]|uniref:Tf2-1-like SH3-like domain-containing protein n=1 Tax=Pisolithus microcarpus 441 TaxID=765257 RepID=A0A0C9YG75_9AGAM|nr:hypothetical protein BKA83DRAFT_114846 [Pisolithus microcarpus]KIK15616.1 hypothetical protein PISMIDRAFT_114846 [Pisolithus microcarpus 441]